MLFWLALVTASTNEINPKPPKEAALYSAGDKLYACAKENAMIALLDHSIDTASRIAEEAVLKCTLERQSVRAAAYEWFLTMAVSDVANDKADATEFELRTNAIRDLKENIVKSREKAARDVAR